MGKVVAKRGRAEGSERERETEVRMKVMLGVI